jgi:hypothetical protein
MASCPSPPAPPLHYKSGAQRAENQAQPWKGHDGKDSARQRPGKATSERSAEQKISTRGNCRLVVLAFSLLLILREQVLENQFDKGIPEQLEEDLDDEFKEQGVSYPISGGDAVGWYIPLQEAERHSSVSAELLLE